MLTDDVASPSAVYVLTIIRKQNISSSNCYTTKGKPFCLVDSDHIVMFFAKKKIDHI